MNNSSLYASIDVDENIMEKFFHTFSLNVHTLIAEHQALKLIDMINFYSKFLEKKNTRTRTMSLFHYSQNKQVNRSTRQQSYVFARMYQLL